ncbi:CheR family methyltransferase [uncultured Pseudoteredinibacter sp.]|uniref:CheR family methyltransferase n=1 Tax=uncultured Pseudoteredinibacter sp. TaxID=1641701 RepID=UPI0026189071|nr:CheR family methyltransferase [uncultured Pseudoteredinibacter sp.]
MDSVQLGQEGWQEEHRLILGLIQNELGWSYEGYSMPSLERQINRVARDLCDGDSLALLRWLQFSPRKRARLLRDALTVNVTDLFRDPEFFLDLKQQCFGYLSEFPQIKIWLAGCSTGEEAFSLAIMLHEAGLLKRTEILATDLDFACLRHARSGVLSGPLARQEAERYRNSGGQASLLEYFSLSYGLSKLRQELLDHIHFAQHGLRGTAPGEQFHMVLCRNVMIYFGADLKSRVLQGFYQSLIPRGYLCLGNKESIEFPKGVELHQLSRHRIYRIQR